MKHLTKNKKGDISLTTIIVAAIGLVVLIVLIAIFTGRINIFGKSYDSTTANAQGRVCNTQPGKCAMEANCNNGKVSGTNNVAGNWIDCGAQEVCCKL